MFRYVFALFLAFTTMSASARAGGDHLEPEPSIFTGIWGFDYYTKVLRVLGELPLRETGFSPGGRAAAYVFPSFRPEYRLAVTVENGHYAISHLQPKISIWGFLQAKEQEAHLDAHPENPSPKTISDEDWARWKKEFAEEVSRLPDSIEDIELERCVREIDQALAKKVFEIWEEMLKQTRYADNGHPGLDGVTYHFTMQSKDHVWGMGGKVWSPSRDSNTGRLAAITETMRRYCVEGGASVLRELEQQVTALSARLEKQQQ